MIGIGIGINRLRGSAFSPAILFSAGEQGFWYDHSDLSTLFQDAAGTTPVTTPGQTVALKLDKSQGLVLGPELLANGGFDTDVSGWTLAAGGLAEVVDGVVTLTNAASRARLSQFIATVSGRSYKLLLTGVSLGNSPAGSPRLQHGSTQVVLAAGTVEFLFVATSSSTEIVLFNNTTTPGLFFSLDDISVRLLPGNHAVQSTGSFQPKYQIAPPRLNLDGVDDRLSTTLNPTASGSIAVRMRSNTASKVAIGSQPASDGRCYIGLASDGSLAGGIGTQATSVIVDQQADRRNRLTYTEDFSNAAWPKLASSVTPNATNAPNDTLTADFLAEDGTSAAHGFQKLGLSISGLTRVAFIYAKAGTRSRIALGATTSGGVVSVQYVAVDLADGSILSTAGEGGFVESVGDGWYKIFLNARVADGSSDRFAVNILRDTDTAPTSYVGTAGMGLYIWGAQLEEGSTATAYQPILGAALRDIRGTWVTGILTWNGSTVALHLDGEQVYSAAQSGAVNTSIPFMVGGLNSNGTGAAFHAGDIARAIVINRVLTAGEIASLTALWSAIE